MERIPADRWAAHTGHVDRYRWAAGVIHPGDVVVDVGCGVGYGAAVLVGTGCHYHGIDKPGVPDATFADLGTFHAADLDGAWPTLPPADVVICFEVLEHLANPAAAAVALVALAGRHLLVSVPTVPTAAVNPHHLHDFTVEQIEALFAGLTIGERWDQPTELAHVWRFDR